MVEIEYIPQNQNKVVEGEARLQRSIATEASKRRDWQSVTLIVLAVAAIVVGLILNQDGSPPALTTDSNPLTEAHERVPSADPTAPFRELLALTLTEVGALVWEDQPDRLLNQVRFGSTSGFGPGEHPSSRAEVTLYHRADDGLWRAQYVTVGEAIVGTDLVVGRIDQSLVIAVNMDTETRHRIFNPTSWDDLSKLYGGYFSAANPLPQTLIDFSESGVWLWPTRSRDLLGFTVVDAQTKRPSYPNERFRAIVPWLEAFAVTHAQESDTEMVGEELRKLLTRRAPGQFDIVARLRHESSVSDTDEGAAVREVEVTEDGERVVATGETYIDEEGREVTVYETLPDGVEPGEDGDD